MAFSHVWLVLMTLSQFTSMLAQSENYIIHMDLSAMPESYSGHHNWYSTMCTSTAPTTTTTTGSKLLYAYSNAMHGFSASLTPSELKAIENSPGFISSTRDVKVTMHTSHSFEFLGLNNVSGAWPISHYGENVIIGVVDSGVWPESKSYNDDGMKEIPSRWKGVCETGTAFNSSMCNKKLIGARSFNKGLLASDLTLNISMNSTRDTDGHGTHTSSTAAGNFVQGASYFGYATGTARGMAPRAHVAIYKTSWDEGMVLSDVIAAIDQAISDGVDVISLSLGFDPLPTSNDPIAVAAFAAMEKGIIVACSAGNSGTDYALVKNGIPWVTTVGASTIDRQLNGIVTLGNGDSVVGRSLYPGKSFQRQVPLVFMDTCNNSTEIKKERKKIVVCVDNDGESVGDQVDMVSNERVAGALFITNGPARRINALSRSSIPAVFLSVQNGQTVRDYIKNGSNPRASLEFQKTNLGTKPVPGVADYSSRGPSRGFPSIMKPDLIAPGTLILAAFPPNIPVANLNSRSLHSNFNLISGTSMASPHVAGITALIKGAHPKWSPAAIRSAMMTTSYVLDNTGAPINDIGRGTNINAIPLDMGSGHVNPNKALDPGLIYDTNADDYVKLLCAMNYTMKEIQVFTRSSKYNCSNASLDLNYPSFISFFEPGNTSVVNRQIFQRTVTNVGKGMSTYNAVLTPMDGFKVNVVPQKLAFTKKHQKQNYTLVVESLGALEQAKFHCALSWVEVGGTHVVRSPIVVTTLGSDTL